MKGTQSWGVEVKRGVLERVKRCRVRIAKARALSHVVPVLGKVHRKMSDCWASKVSWAVKTAAR